MFLFGNEAFIKYKFLTFLQFCLIFVLENLPLIEEMGIIEYGNTTCQFEVWKIKHVATLWN